MLVIVFSVIINKIHSYNNNDTSGILLNILTTLSFISQLLSVKLKKKSLH